jgi:hypothetical protein
VAGRAALVRRTPDRSPASAGAVVCRGQGRPARRSTAGPLVVITARAVAACSAGRAGCARLSTLPGPGASVRTTTCSATESAAPRGPQGRILYRRSCGCGLSARTGRGDLPVAGPAARPTRPRTPVRWRAGTRSSGGRRVCHRLPPAWSPAEGRPGIGAAGTAACSGAGRFGFGPMCAGSCPARMSAGGRTGPRPVRVGAPADAGPRLAGPSSSGARRVHQHPPAWRRGRVLRCGRVWVRAGPVRFCRRARPVSARRVHQHPPWGRRGRVIRRRPDLVRRTPGVTASPRGGWGSVLRRRRIVGGRRA